MQIRPFWIHPGAAGGKLGTGPGSGPLVKSLASELQRRFRSQGLWIYKIDKTCWTPRYGCFTI